MSQALRVGVAGLRRGGGFVNVLARHPAAELVAVADPDAERRDAVGEASGVDLRLTGFDVLLDAAGAARLDAVVVATPAPDHAAQCIAALDAGLHVVSEVPAVFTLHEAADLVRAVRAARGSYFLAENVNSFDRTVAWQAFIDAGHLGDVFYAEAEYVHNCDPLFTDAAGRPTWRAALPPIQYCTHSLGPLLAWTGDRCISACGLHTGSHVRPDLGTIDMEVGIFRTAAGAVFKVLCGFSVACEPGRHWYCLYGTEGMLESGRTADSPDRGFVAARAADTAGPAADVVPTVERPAPAGAAGGHGNSEWFMIDAWLRSVVDGAPAPVDVYAGLDMTLPGLCAHASAQQGGQPVEIPDPRTFT